MCPGEFCASKFCQQGQGRPSGRVALQFMAGVEGDRLKKERCHPRLFELAKVKSNGSSGEISRRRNIKVSSQNFLVGQKEVDQVMGSGSGMSH